MAKLTIGILLLVLCLLPQSVPASSGGRSGGGSFKRSEPSREPSRSRDSSSSPSRDNSSTYQERNTYPGSYSNPSSSSGGSSFSAIAFLLIVLVLGAGALVFAKSSGMSMGEADAGNLQLPRDVRNERVTVSKIQIALYATARSVQTEIRQLSESADLDTKEGLRHFLREALIILQRNTDAWCYALGTSQFYDRSTAIEKFDALSTEERMKFSAETFSRMANQKMTKKDYANEAEVPEFIIVTLLIGTEHDKPLFEPIKTREDVKNALTACLGITATYLLTVELLWTPESDRDSLTKDDLIAQYTDLQSL